MVKRFLKQLSANRNIVLLIILGSVTWSITMIKSGFKYDYGIGFWGANGHDGIWHLALSGEILRAGIFNINQWQMPTFAGEKLMNYHVGFDLILAILHKLTSIPLDILYFQVLPPLMAIIIGILTAKFVISWKKDKLSAIWSLFFVYFGGSMGWLVVFLQSQGFGGESMFWAQQAISTLINPPYALSLILLLVILIKLQKANKKFIDYLILIILSGILIQIKAYAGVLVLGGLFTSGVWQFIKYNKFNLLLVFLFSLIISIIVFVPFNRSSGGLLTIYPFWFLETMMILTDRVGWTNYGEAMINYKTGKVYYKLIPSYIIAFLIFWYGNLSTRLFSEIYIGKKLANFKKLEIIEVFIFSIIFAGVILPMFFVQSGTAWNTIQFFYYSLFLLAILSGIVVSKVKSKLILFLIIFSTIPTSLISLKNIYLPNRPPTAIRSEEVSALDYLRDQQNGVVLTYPFKDVETKEPKPIYAYTSTAYVSAYANKRIFLEDEINLNITGYNWIERRSEVEEFFKTTDVGFAREFLDKNNISYLYLAKKSTPNFGEQLRFSIQEAELENIFENEEIVVYKVK